VKKLVVSGKTSVSLGGIVRCVNATGSREGSLRCQLTFFGLRMNVTISQRDQVEACIYEFISYFSSPLNYMES
jgi:hypothetical protein